MGETVGTKALGTLDRRAPRQARVEGEGGLGAVGDVDLAQVLVTGEAGVDAPEHHVDFGVLKVETEEGEGAGDLFLTDAHGRLLVAGVGWRREAEVSGGKKPSSWSQVRRSIRTS